MYITYINNERVEEFTTLSYYKSTFHPHLQVICRRLQKSYNEAHLKIKRKKYIASLLIKPFIQNIRREILANSVDKEIESEISILFQKRKLLSLDFFWKRYPGSTFIFSDVNTLFKGHGPCDESNISWIVFEIFFITVALMKPSRICMCNSFKTALKNCDNSSLISTKHEYSRLRLFEPPRGIEIQFE